MESAADVVARDLRSIGDSLAEEFSQMAGRRLLITGGAGFLGYYLIQSVLAWNRRTESGRQIRMTVYDNYQRGLAPWLRSLERDDPALELVQYDVTRPLPADMPHFDYLVHAASIASPTFYREHPVETMDANVEGLRQLLDFMRLEAERNRPPIGCLFFSSSEIYGDPPPEAVPTDETYPGSVSCTGPRACYDESKRYGETLAVNFARQYGIPITIARPFNNYGPGLKIDDGRVVADFARNVLVGQDIVMYSEGTPRRTFCYVADAVSGYYKVLVRGTPGEAYNIGVEKPEISILDLAQLTVRLAEELFGYSGRVVRHESTDPDYLTDNPQRRCPRIEKARSQLGYDPGVSLEDGMRRSLTWYRENQNATETRLK